MPIGPTGAAALGAAADIFGSWMSGKSAKRLQDDQQRWARKMYTHRYQFTMKDMYKAGLNPILAGEIGAGSTPSSGMAQAPDYRGIGSRAVASAAALKQQDAQTRSIVQGEAESRAREALAYSQQRKNDAEWAAQVERNPTILTTIDKQNKLMDSQAEANSARAVRDRSDAGRITTPLGSFPVGLFERMYNAWSERR